MATACISQPATGVKVRPRAAAVGPAGVATGSELPLTDFDHQWYGASRDCHWA